MKYDLIVLGGGHNGLVMATLAAKRGKKVALIEKRAQLGGLAARREFAPGFFSTGVLQETREFSTELVDALGLKQFGLEYFDRSVGVRALSVSQPSFELSLDREKTASQLAKINETTARSYLEYRAFFDRTGEFLRSVVSQATPEVLITGSGLWEAAKMGLGLRRLGARDMTDLLRLAPMCVADLVQEWIKPGQPGDFNDHLSAQLAGPAVFGTWCGPWSPGTALYALLHEAILAPHIKGGPAAVVDTLERAAKRAGVEILTHTEVTQLMIHERTVKGVKLANGEEWFAPLVASSLDPKTTFLKLCPPGSISHELEHASEKTRARGTTAKLCLAVDGEVRDLHGAPVSFACVTGGLDDVERAFDSVKYGEYSQLPALEISVQSSQVEGLAPQGKNVVEVLVHYAPYELRSGWTSEIKQRFTQTVLARLKEVLPTLKIEATETLTPLDLEREFGMSGGHIHHVEHALDQFMTRPFASCAQHRTPVTGLILCGSGSHPGGGLTGRPGTLAASVL